MKKKQNEQSGPTTTTTQNAAAIVNKGTADVSAAPQQQQQRKTTTTGQSGKIVTLKQRKGPAPSDSPDDTPSQRQVILPSHKMSAVINEATKPILRTIINQKAKGTSGGEVSVERRAVTGPGVSTPSPLRIPIGKKAVNTGNTANAAAAANTSKAANASNAPKKATADAAAAPVASGRISIHERFSSSQFKPQREQPPPDEPPAPAKKPKKPSVSIAAVVRDISGWDGALGRLTLIAGTVGNVKVSRDHFIIN